MDNEYIVYFQEVDSKSFRVMAISQNEAIKKAEKEWQRRYKNPVCTFAGRYDKAQEGL